jgi:hypothetical protein
MRDQSPADFEADARDRKPGRRIGKPDQPSARSELAQVIKGME